MAALNLLPKCTAKILYFTDKFGVSDGYKRAFNEMMLNSGINWKNVTITHIYNLVSNALVKKGNRKALGFNPEKKNEIKAAFDLRINAVQPDVIVVSCPAVLGLLCDWDWNLATLDKCRGGVYYYDGIPVLVTYPITAINSHVDERALKSVDDDDDAKSEPYKVKQGQWILNRDWEKIGRYANGRQIVIPAFEYAVCRTIDDVCAAKNYLGDCVAIAVDIETGGFPAAITCVGFAGLHRNGTCRSFVVPFTNPFNEASPGNFWEDESDHSIAWSLTGDILSSPVLKVMQNGLYDCSYFIKYGLDCRNYLLDSMYLWYSWQMELPKTLDFISSILLDNFQYWKDDIKGIENEAVDGRAGMEQYWRYNAQDCYNTLFSALRLTVLLDSIPYLQTNYRDTWLRAMSALSMQMRGLRADKNRLNEHRTELIAVRDKAVAEFRFMIDDPNFNIDSPAQKCHLLYDVLGARERTARGRFVDHKKDIRGENSRSAGKYPMKMIKTDHPFFKLIIEKLESAMEPNKQLSDVFGNLNPDGTVRGGIRMFTHRFRYGANPVGTVTTRYSTKGSNFWDGRSIQNIREEYQDWMVADDHCLLMEVDYSQSDDVFIGYESNDQEKIRVIESGVDGHAVHGELFFGIPYQEIVAGKKADDPRITHPVTGVRQISKRVVHGTNFQMAALTLYLTQMGRDATVYAATLLGFADAHSWPQDRLVNVCKYLMGQYRKKYPRLNKKEWYAEIYRELKTTGAIVNAFGIRRNFLGDPDDNGTQREATGFIGQSATAGNMNRSQYEIDHGYMPERFRDGPNPDFRDRPRRMDWFSHGFMFLVQKHDSFVASLDTRNPNWREAAHNLLHVMNRPVIINGHVVRVRVECKFGKRWSKREGLEWDGKDSKDLDAIAKAILN